MDFKKAVCSSVNTRKHIHRAYYQLQLWIQGPFRDATTNMTAESSGFVKKDGLLIPEVVISKPDGLPDPCTCGKCIRKNGCPCRVAGIKCCQFCKCKRGDSCKNPIREWTFLIPPSFLDSHLIVIIAQNLSRKLSYRVITTFFTKNIKFQGLNCLWLP